MSEIRAPLILSLKKNSHKDNEFLDHYPNPFANKLAAEDRDD